MNRVLVSFCFLFLLCSLTFAQMDRFSSNPIPKLNAFAVAMSEDLEGANYVINDIYKGMMKMPIDFEIYIDPTYKKLGEQKAFDLSFFGESATGKKFESKVDDEFNLKANTFTFLVIDRQKKVRAFAQVSTIELDNFSRVIEELLLNINGEEKITVDSEEEDVASGWQTDLGKFNEAKENEGTIVIDFGAGEKKWYKYLGEEIPNVDLKKTDGTGVEFYDLLNGEVSLVLVIMASKEPDALYKSAGIALEMTIMNDFYHSFTLGESEPGDEWVENAFGNGTEPMKKVE